MMGPSCLKLLHQNLWLRGFQKNPYVYPQAELVEDSNILPWFVKEYSEHVDLRRQTSLAKQSGSTFGFGDENHLDLQQEPDENKHQQVQRILLQNATKNYPKQSFGECQIILEAAVLQWATPRKQLPPVEWRAKSRLSFRPKPRHPNKHAKIHACIIYKAFVQLGDEAWRQSVHSQRKTSFPSCYIQGKNKLCMLVGDA